MSGLRDYLRNLLARKVDTYGLVIWDDPQREYEGVAREVCPPRTTFEQWAGSWYRLRRTIEPLVSDSRPPRLVVYLPVTPPSREEDPLAEIRDAGTVFKTRLPTLIKDALSGVLTASRIDELARARTFLEAEVALSSGQGTGVRLPAILGTTDTLQLALRILADPTVEKLSAEGLWEEARAVLAHTFGGAPSGDGEALRYHVFRHIALLELEHALGRLPEGLARGRGDASREQRAQALELLRTWRRDIDRLSSYRNYALWLERELDLPAHLPWTEALGELDTVPCLERLAMTEALRLIETGDPGLATNLATKRLRSIWVRAPVPEAATWDPVWTATAAVAELLRAVRKVPIPHAAGVEGLVRWYAQEGWRIDQLHRRMEAALLDLPAFGELESAVSRARTGYEGWLEELLECFTTAVGNEGLETSLARQSSVHKVWLARSDTLTAYVVVDALRYELAHELVEGLRATHPRVEIHAAVASVPTVTPVGMASLLPGAELGIRLELTGGKLTPVVDGVPVRNIGDRLALLRHAHGEVADLLLSDVLNFGEREIRERVGSARVILVRSQEIDTAFESDEIAAWRYIREIHSLIERALARLAAAGVERFVLASDHGFLILSRRLDQSRVIGSPGGEGELHRRFWIGRGGAAPPTTIRMPVAQLGIGGDLDLIVPKGLTLFGAPGARRFFHGGISPQEVLVPVIEVFSRAAPAPGVPKVKARIAGDRITTGVFSASVSLEPDLFSKEIRLRLRVRNKAGLEVARPVAGEFQEGTDTVILSSDPDQHDRIVTFRVTVTLRKGERVTLEVYDVDGDRQLATATALVASDVRVDHETS